MAAPAQNVTFVGAERGIISSPSIAGIALDGNGNLFVADFHDGTVEEILAVDGSIPLAPTVKTLASGFGSGIQGEGYTGPGGIAVDAKGDIFVTDPNYNAVKEIVAVDGSIPVTPTIKTLGSGFGAPWQIAVDGGGNVFVADTGNNAIKEVLAAGGYTTVNTLGNGFYFRSPQGVAVDTKGNVYVGDTLNSAVREILAVDGSVRTISSGFFEPLNVAVDGSGNVYYAIGSATNSVQEILAVNGSIPADPTIQSLSFLEDFDPITSVALDRWGKLFVVYSTDYIFNYSDIFELQTQNVNFEDVEVCPSFAPCNYSLTLTYNLAANTTIGSIKVLTQGAPNLDFQPLAKDTSTTLCALQTYTSATTCTVDVTFAPLAPGQRNGAVQILDGSGNVLSTTLIYGTGIAPQMTFHPGTLSSLPITNIFQPYDVKVDAAGNIYIVQLPLGNPQRNAVLKETWTGSGYVQTTVAIGLDSPSAVAVDGAGNVYIDDQDKFEVIEETPLGGTYTQSIPLSDLGNVEGIAVDSSGTLYIASDVLGVLKETPNLTGGYTQSTIAGSVFGGAIAVDSKGNVYVTDTSNNRVLEETPSNGSYIQSTVAGDLNNPVGIAVDAIGDIYITTNNSEDSQVLEEVPSAGTYRQEILASNLPAPASLAVDSMGNVYFAEIDNNQIEKLDFADPPSLNFAATPEGHTSSDSPQSVQLQNIGNVPLTGSGALSDFTDFTVVAGPQIVPDCNPETLSLAPAAECNLSLKFTPQSVGPLNTTLTLSDNSLNGPTVQAIQLSGTGEVAPQITALTPNYGAPAALINITGVNFGATQGTVTVGGALSHIVSWSNTAIAIQVPSRATTGDIVVTAGGEASNGVPFTFYPYPAVTGMSPASGPAGTPVIITGTGLFDGGGSGVVTFNGMPATILSETASSIKVDVPFGAVTGPISVRANGDTVKSSIFTVSPSPEITSLTPNYGAPAALIKIAGTDFGATQGNGSVTVGGAPSRVVSWSNTAIAVQVPSRATTGNIVVSSDGLLSNGAAFTFYPYPAVTDISPITGPVGTTVTLTGTGLLDGGGKAAITFDGTPATIVSQSSTSIQANVPVGATTGPISVFVNGDTVKAPGNFYLSVPQINALNPSYGAPAALINIIGTNFGATQGNSYVTINGAVCGVTAWSDISITIRVPSNASTGNLVVRVGRESSNGAAFSFYPYPAIASVSPGSGAVGTPVTITGSNLLDGGNNATVTFNGIPAAIVSDTASQIQVNIPTGATSGRLLVRVNGVTLIGLGNFAVTTPPHAASYDVGPDYYATGEDFLHSSFITAYQDASVRAQVLTQLQGIADRGATVVSMRIWFVTEPGTSNQGESWRATFPMSGSEQANLRTYAQDVAAIKGAGGNSLRLDIGLFWLGAADYTTGSPSTGLGDTPISAATFTTRVEQTTDSVLAAITNVKRSDGTPVVDTVYMEGEVQIGAKANQEWFMTTHYPRFVSKVSAAGFRPSVYFIVADTQANVLQNDYFDADFPILNNHRSMFWVYRTLNFMSEQHLPIPPRIDFSYYVPSTGATYPDLLTRVLNDADATLPSLGATQSYGIAETYYFADDTQRRAFGQAFATEAVARPRLRRVTFWTTPDGGGEGVDIAYPFAIADYLPSP